MDKPKSIANQRVTKTIVKTRELAEILGIGKRHVFHLAAKGYLKKTGYGEFELAKSVQGYIRHIKKHCYKIIPMTKGG